MSIFVVDIESDGPIPHKNSMVCFGAVKVDPKLDATFYGKTAPISDVWLPDALAISGFSREEHLTFPDPEATMKAFVEWVKASTKGRPVFISDNLAYDWQWINYYTHYYVGENPFGFSGRRIGDFYSGLEKDWFKTSEWKKFRKTTHTHNPVDDAKGNAEAILEIAKQYKIRIPY